MKEHKRHIERDDLKGATHLEVSVFYDKGGANYFSGGTTQRGYYLSVRPVTKSDRMVSFVMFAGKKRFLLETARFSQKQLDRAVELAKAHEDELIAAVVAENKAA